MADEILALPVPKSEPIVNKSALLAGMIFRTLLIAFLLLTAFLKIGPFLEIAARSEPLPGIVALPYFIAAILELSFAAWLYASPSSRMCRTSLMVFFAAAGVTSLVFHFRGELSCGCLGALKTPPLLSFGISVGFLFLSVLLWKPMGVTRQPSKQRDFGKLVVPALILVATIALVTTKASDRLLDRLSGSQAVLVKSTPLNVIVSLPDGASEQCKFEVRNLSATRSEKLIGWEGGCGVSSVYRVDGLPVELAPGQATTLWLAVDYPALDSKQLEEMRADPKVSQLPESSEGTVKMWLLDESGSRLEPPLEINMKFEYGRMLAITGDHQGN